MDIPDWLRGALVELRRPEQIGGNEWAEKYRVLGPDESDKHGRWRSVPWQRELLDAFADDSLTRVTIMKGAQFGVSDLVRNAIGRWAMVDPGDVLWVMADEQSAKKAMRKLRAMFENTPELRPLLSRTSASTLLELRLTNMRVVIGWAGSAASLASEPFRRVVLDEVAKYRWHVQGEGSPVALAEERVKTFGRRGKIIMLSTPKHPDDQIVKAHRETLDRRVFAVPCPACGHRQVPEIDALRWPGGSTATAPADPDARVRLASVIRRDQTAWVECAGCRGHVQPHQAMNAPTAGWVREEEVEPDDRRAYHVAEFVHWQTTTSDLAARWLRCTHPKELSEFWNGSLGLPFTAAAGSLRPTLFAARARHANGVVPSWATAVLATADTQGDHFWLMVRAWGPGGRSRLLDWGRVGSFEELEKRALRQRFEVEGRNDTAGSRFLMIDSGGGMARKDGSRTNDVYQFARRTPHVLAAKGVGDQDVDAGKPIRPSRVTYTPPGGPAPTIEQDLHLLHAEYWKDAAAALIRAERPELWEECESAAAPEYGRQLAGEHKVMVTEPNGDTYYRWQKRSKHAQEHLWDCYDAETEVLTRDGFRFFRDLAGDEFLATVDLATDLIEYQQPLALVRRRHVGEMIKIGGGPRQRMDLVVTPGHRMVTAGTPRRQVKTADSLTVRDRLKTSARWEGRPACPPDVGKRVAPEDLAELFGWYVAEGYCAARPNRKRPSSIGRQVHICQNEDGPWAPALRELLDRLPWHYSVSRGRVFNLSSKALYEALAPLGHAHEKRVPQWIKDSPPSVIAAFVRGAVYGDGWDHKGHEVYATISPGLADDMVELYLKLGFGASVVRRAPKPWAIRGRTGAAREQFHVHRRTVGPAHLRDGRGVPSFRRVAYDGEVFCATVPNGTLIVRRNGKIVVCGNCAWMQVAAAEIARVDGEAPIPARLEARTKAKKKARETRGSTRARLPDGRPYHVGRR